MNIAEECIDRHRGNGTAMRLKLGDGSTETYSFEDLSRLSSQFANALENQGVKMEDRVAIMLHPCLEFYTCLYGGIKRGARAVPGSPLFGPEGVKMRLSGDKMLITTEEIAKKVSAPDMTVLTQDEVLDMVETMEAEYEPADTSAKDIAMIQYSSGTTGKPKPIKYPHQALPTTLIPAIFCIGLEPNDRYFNPSPPSWGFGIWYGTMAPLGLGTALGSYGGKFDVKRILEALEEFEINNFSLVPTALRKIVNSEVNIDDYDLQIEKLSYTGGALSASQFRRVEETFGVPPTGLYGSTEVGVVIANYACFDKWKYKAGSLGKPMPGLEVAVIDEDGHEVDGKGEIAVKLGGEWRRVGDIGEIDENGYFWHKGRADDVIISSGYTIGPQEVEEPLLKHEAVQEAAAVGVPDEERGEIVKAYIKLNPGFEASGETKKEIRDFAKKEISKHAYPREIEFIEDFPKTESGKIKRKELREKK